MVSRIVSVLILAVAVPALAEIETEPQDGDVPCSKKFSVQAYVCDSLGNPIADTLHTVVTRRYSRTGLGLESLISIQTDTVQSADGMISLLVPDSTYGPTPPIPCCPPFPRHERLTIQVDGNPDATEPSKVYASRFSMMSAAMSGHVITYDGGLAASADTVDFLPAIYLIGRDTLMSGGLPASIVLRDSAGINRVSIESDGDVTFEGRGHFGRLNSNAGLLAFVAGESNEASGDYSVAFGTSNLGSGLASTVGGGVGNTASGPRSSVVGGSGNSASGVNATVAGGRINTATGYTSFAAGFHANATHTGSFVWSDSASTSNFTSTADNQFSARSIGGVRFVSAVDGAGSPTAGVQLAAGGGSWGSISDQSVKDHVETVDGAMILSRLRDIPISKWNYRSQADSIRHIGPMAQDFYSAFGVGEDNRHITTIDGIGVALAAIQALDARTRELEDLRQQHASQEVMIADLCRRLADLDEELQKLARATPNKR